MKLYFNKTFGEWICAGNGISAMDEKKADAIKMALDIVERYNLQKSGENYLSAVKEWANAAHKKMDDFSAYNQHVEMEDNRATGN